ncbi:MAG: tRNA epoxyqueuosine(34) reductase QueG [Bacteroidales bacterium]|nr:tRNA epoxyqueuosine(34) reductase QueG [Bacteroidales bacterium]
MQGKNYSEQIKSEAIRLGFNACGIARAEPLKTDETNLKTWLDKKMHAGMAYMSGYFEKRIDPVQLVPGTKSIISVLLSYHTGVRQEDGNAPIISTYAYGKDYHRVMKKKLRLLLQYIQNIIEGADGRVFVDSAPVLERAWAARAGLGWIGKNSMLISPKWGSFVFIGSVFINIELEYDEPIKEMCGGCAKCLENCPTGAIIRPKVIDAHKCISYLTIENKGPIPEIFRHKMHNRVFGCDICQDVCPWNRKAPFHNITDFVPRKELLEMKGADWANITEENFNRLFEGSAVKRAKYQGFKRNIEFLLK